MADSPAPAPDASGPVFSLDDIDKIIEAEDPNFKNELNAIQKEKVEATESIESLQVDAETEIDKEDDEKPSAAKRLLGVIFRPVVVIRAFIRLRIIRLKSNLSVFLEKSIEFFRHGLPERIKYSKSQIVAGAKWSKGRWREYMALSQTQKMALVFIALSSAAALFFFSKTFTGHWLPSYEDPLPRSLAPNGSIIREVKSKSDLQDLFQAFPQAEYDVLLGKIVVNLKPSDSSGPNPMGAFEVFVGVDSQDTAVEVKDREDELMDLIQRTIETFTYDVAASTVGKERMKEAIRDSLNKVLNQGRVFHIYFNTFILYSGN